MNEVNSLTEIEPLLQINGSSRSRLKPFIEDGLGSIHSNDIALAVSPVSSSTAEFAGFIRQDSSDTQAGRKMNYTELVNMFEKCVCPENLSSDGFEINNNRATPQTMHTKEVSFAAEPTFTNEVKFTQSDKSESSQASEALKLTNDGSSNAKIDHSSTDSGDRSTATTEDKQSFFDDLNSSAEFTENSVESDDDVMSLTSNDYRDASTSTTRRSRINQPFENLTRKRSTNRWRWKSVQRKQNVNSGQEYVGATKNLVPERRLQRPCDVSCRFGCVNRITNAQRQQIMTKFWLLGERYRQWNYIFSSTKLTTKNAGTADASKKKRKFKTYWFHIDGNEIKVCKTMFLSTLDISDTWIKTIMAKLAKGGDISPDRRGRHAKRGNKISAEVENSVVDHINAFPRTDSHYTRKSSSREYLEESLSVKQMHELYLIWVEDNVNQMKPATERQYRDIFNNRFNIRFFKPKKDQCDICSVYQNASDAEKRDLQEQYDLHVSNKIRAREPKDTDKADCLNEENGRTISMACFDYQKVLQTPQAQTSIFYYKREFAVYNFTVYDVGRREGNCYCYDETIANKGSNEVASLLLDYIDTKVRNGVQDFRFYSDNCSGQNRNRFVFSMYVYAASKYRVKITHRFLERGHTQNEGDSVHALIERRCKNHLIYTPEQWYDIIRNAKRTKSNPYKVLKVDQSMVYNFKKLVERQNWAKNVEKQTIAWSKIREVYADGNDPGILHYKLSFASEYSQLRTEHKINPIALSAYTLETAYKAKLGITALKLKDLISLCNSKAIPTEHQSFYRNLKALTSTEKRVAEEEHGSESENEEPMEGQKNSRKKRNTKDDQAIVKRARLNAKK